MAAKRVTGPTGPALGVSEWFRPGDRARVEAVLEDLRSLEVGRLRVGVCWSDALSDEGEEWYDWLLPRLAREAEVMPCLFQAAPARLGRPRWSARALAEYVETFVRRHGESFSTVELWHELDQQTAWAPDFEDDRREYCERIGETARALRRGGQRVVLGGISSLDHGWLRLLLAAGTGPAFDAVGLYGYPGTREAPREGWREAVRAVAAILAPLGADQRPAIWITETGCATASHAEQEQIQVLLDAVETPVERVYWHSARDLAPDADAGADPELALRETSYGLRRADGTPKILYRLWAGGGLGAVREVGRWNLARRPLRRRTPPVLITGGAGFIGTNLADAFLRAGRPVLLFDNLSRPGVEENLSYLKAEYGDRVELDVADIRCRSAVRHAVRRAGAVFHLAAQVAVTTSVADPRADFEVNAGGTLNLLEEIRALSSRPPLVFTSTNKVYGALADVKVAERHERYEPVSAATRARGIGADRALDFYSPYGCSKGAADQYVLDYARTYRLPAVVFRMSCIYGPHQCGTEDQGWVAHFLISAIEGRPLTLYGDGKQVRDVLYVNDLVAALQLASARAEELAGSAFNLGGGPRNTVSLRQLLDLVVELHGSRPEVRHGDWRIGDQKYYVSDTEPFSEATGWYPRVEAQEGIKRLYQWLLETRSGVQLARAGQRS